MNSPKYFFKHTLKYQKGKVLDEKLIAKLAQQLEQDVIQTGLIK